MFDALGQEVNVGDLVAAVRPQGHSGCGGKGRRSLHPATIVKITEKSICIVFNDDAQKRVAGDFIVRKPDEVVKVALSA